MLRRLQAPEQAGLCGRVAGLIVDGGTFDWTNGNFPGFTTPDPSYHGVVFAELGPPAFALKARVQLLREAYVKAFQEPELLAEAKKARMDIQLLAGADVERDMREAINQPKEVVGALAAVAPISGLARVISVTPEVALAIGSDIDQAFETCNGDERW